MSSDIIIILALIIITGPLAAVEFGAIQVFGKIPMMAQLGWLPAKLPMQTQIPYRLQLMAM